MDEANLLQAWIELQQHRFGARTFREYQRYVTLFLEENTIPLDDIDADDLTRWITSHDNWSAGTQHVALRALRAFWKWLVKKGHVAANVAADVEAPKQDEPIVRASTTAIRDELVAAASVRDRALIELLHSGPRFSEVARLTIDDIDLEAGTIHIRKSKTRKGRFAPLVEPRVVQALRAWLDERGDTGHTALWTKRNGAPLSEAGTMIATRRAAERAGVAWSCHDGRRYLCEAWLERGGSEALLMRAAGWSSPTMIARYSRVNAERLAVDQARKLFGGEET